MHAPVYTWCWTKGHGKIRIIISAQHSVSSHNMF
uniref:Uncharacterized protein n=1 Tax=Anguilla anguilla TaxID=7936 RepID=A0A0E9SDY7_ANGAN